MTTRTPADRDASFTDDAVAPMASVVAFLRRRWRWLVVPAVAAAVGLGAYALLRPRTFTASASFMPQSHGATSRLAALAAQFSLPVSTGDPSESPQFFVDVIKSRAFLRTIADTALPVSAPSGRTATERVADIVDVPAGPAPVRLERAADALDRYITATVSPKTGVVTVAATARDPVVAAALANAVLQSVNRFNLDMRQRQAAAEREFTQQRLDEARGDVGAAEDRLQAFLQANQLFRTSSRLSVEEDRLRRDVSAKQELYNTLVQAYEQAKLDQLRDTPMINVVSAPYVPVLPDPRGALRFALLGLIAGALCGAAAALGVDALGGGALRRSADAVAETPRGAEPVTYRVGVR